MCTTLDAPLKEKDIKIVYLKIFFFKVVYAK